MSNRAFNKITQGLREALSIARGDAKPARLHITPFCGSVRFYAQSDHGLGAGPITTAWRGANLFNAYRARTGHRNGHASAAA